MTDIKTIIFKTSKNIRVEKHRRRVINLRFKRDSRVEIFIENFLRGGGERIRTSDNLAAILVFKTSPIVHSGTPPNINFDSFSRNAGLIRLAPKARYLSLIGESH